MKVPDTIKLGGRTYKLLVEKRTYDKDENITWGEIDYDRNSIFLNENANPDAMRVTLLHEIIHWIFYVSGQSEMRKDEALIVCLTEHLMMAFRDNPDLASQIFGQE